MAYCKLCLSLALC